VGRRLKMKRRTMLTALALAVSGSQLSHKSEGKTVEALGPVTVSQEAAAVEREFRVSREKRLELDLETGGGIDIVGVDHDVVSVRLYPGGRDWQDCKFEAEETPTGVRISSYYAGTQKQYSTSLRFELRVPRRFNVEINSNGGNIQIAGVEGVIRGKTMGGGLTLSGLKGDVHLTTMGGDVTLTDSEVDGRLETFGGAVLIRNTTGDIKGSSGSGNVIYRNVTDRSGRSVVR
jgi:hypothetical protein